MEKESCYYCGKDATSREHVPPLAIFPEQKDFDGINFRKELITVPSCVVHNQKKSKDDEFLMACLAGVVGNNKIGFIQTKTKVARAFQRAKKLSNAVMKDVIEFELEGKDGAVYPIQIGKSDNKRLIKCFKLIAYGLYFYEFGKQFKGECRVIPGFLKYSDPELKVLIELLKKKEEMDSSKWNRQGKNTDVFYYQFSSPDEFGLISLILTFYSGTKVYIAFKDDSINFDNNLIHLLLKNGHPITVSFPDGNEYKFNSPSSK